MFSLFGGSKSPNPPLIDPDTYAKLLNRITERDAEIGTLKNKVAALEVDVAHLRGKLTSKLRELLKEVQAESEQAEKDISSNEVYL